MKELDVHGDDDVPSNRIVAASWWKEDMTFGDKGVEVISSENAARYDRIQDDTAEVAVVNGRH